MCEYAQNDRKAVIRQIRVLHCVILLLEKVSDFKEHPKQSIYDCRKPTPFFKIEKKINLFCHVSTEKCFKFQICPFSVCSLISVSDNLRRFYSQCRSFSLATTISG